MYIELDSLLLEEAVFLAMRRREQTGDRAMVRDYRDRLDALYDSADEDLERDIAFRDMHAEFFGRLHFERTLRDYLDEFPLLGRELDRVSFMKAISHKEEGAELFVRKDEDGGDGPHRVAVVRLRAELFLQPDQLLTLLRHELYHISDMLDPAFDYRPDLGERGESIARENLIRDRYRALWLVYIEARLVRAGRATAAMLRQRLGLLKKAFEGLDDSDVEAMIPAAPDAESLTHADLLRLARTGFAETAVEVTPPRATSDQLV